MEHKREISFLLRGGLAFVFIYSGISSFANPYSWVGFVPNIVKLIISRETFLFIFSIFQIILGMWLFSNYKVRIASIFSIISLSGIIIFNISSLEIIYRDIAILSMAVVLAIMERD